MKFEAINRVKFATYFFVLCFAVAIVIPDYLSGGLFMDGLIYGTISRNMAEGIGSFWHPVMSDTLFNPFREHLPLQIYLTSWLFKIFPDHNFLIEKIGGAVLYVVSILFTFKIRKSASGEADKNTNWLLLTFLIFPPSIAFIYTRNMLEIGLTIAVLGAVWSGLKVVSRTGSSQLFFLLLMSVCVVAGFLCKGPVAFFPLAFFVLYFVSHPSYTFKSALRDSAVLFLLMIIGLAPLWFYEPAYVYLKDYLPRMVGGAVEGQKEQFNLNVLSFLFNETIGIAGLGLVFILINKFLLKKSYEFNREKAFLFLYLGLSASLPLLLSARQVPYYIAPSYYFYALSGYYFFVEPMKNIIFKPAWRKLNTILWTSIGTVVLFFGLRLSIKSYQTTRLADEKHDIKILLTVLESHESLNVRRDDWRFSQAIHPLFYRWGYVNFDPKDENKHRFLIGKQGDDYNLSTQEYKEVTEKYGLISFSLYEYVGE